MGEPSARPASAAPTGRSAPADVAASQKMQGGRFGPAPLFFPGGQIRAYQRLRASVLEAELTLTVALALTPTPPPTPTPTRTRTRTRTLTLTRCWRRSEGRKRYQERPLKRASWVPRLARGWSGASSRSSCTALSGPTLPRCGDSRSRWPNPNPNHNPNPNPNPSPDPHPHPHPNPNPNPNPDPDPDPNPNPNPNPNPGGDGCAGGGAAPICRPGAHAQHARRPGRA